MTHVRHGRTARDAKNLARHLLRQDGNDWVEVVAIVGLAAADLPGALAAMRRLAPRRSSAAFHHLSLSPSQTLATEDLRADADRMLQEMGVDPAAHPHVVVVHGKTSAAGRANCHAHLVVAHWNLDGVALDDAWLHLRLERMAREIEHDRGNRLTPGRHDRALAKALRVRGRPEVAAALEAAVREGPPRSATSPRARQRVRRAGVDDVAARAAVKAAWASTAGAADFRLALADAGLSVTPGEKTGVWTVTAAGGVVVGALDRIVREKRAVVAARMEEETDDRTAPAYVPVAPRPGKGDPESGPDHRRTDQPAYGASRPIGGEGGTLSPRGSARDNGRHTSGSTGDIGPPFPDRGGPTPPSPASRPDRAVRIRRIRDAAAARYLARGLNAVAIREEASKRYLAARLAEVEVIYRHARQERDAARASIPEPVAVAEARIREDQAGEEARRVLAKAKAAEARRASLEAQTPTGWRRSWWWIRGRLRPHREALATATTAASRARDVLMAHARVVSGRAFDLEVELEKAARRHPIEVQQRRTAEATAALTMERAAIAADLLRADPGRGALPLPDLLRLAEAERRRKETSERAREVAAAASGPSFGPR